MQTAGTPIEWTNEVSGRKPDQKSKIIQNVSGIFKNVFLHILWEELGMQYYVWEPAIQDNILIFILLQSFQINQLDRNHTSFITAFQLCLGPVLLSVSFNISPPLLREGGSSSVFSFPFVPLNN